MVKSYAAMGGLHGAIDAARRLRASVAAKSISHIDITVGTTSVSDGSSLAPFDSLTEIVPTPVANWNLRLIGIDADGALAKQLEFDGERVVTKKNLQPLKGFDQVVAIIAYDEPTELQPQYAPYTLTVNGVIQPGGGG